MQKQPHTERLENQDIYTHWYDEDIKYSCFQNPDGSESVGASRCILGRQHKKVPLSQEKEQQVLDIARKEWIKFKSMSSRLQNGNILTTFTDKEGIECTCILKSDGTESINVSKSAMPPYGTDGFYVEREHIFREEEEMKKREALVTVRDIWKKFKAEESFAKFEHAFVCVHRNQELHEQYGDEIYGYVQRLPKYGNDLTLCYFRPDDSFPFDKERLCIAPKELSLRELTYEERAKLWEKSKKGEVLSLEERFMDYLLYSIVD